MGAGKSKASVDQKQKFLDEMVQKCGVTSCKNYSGPIKVHASGDSSLKNIKISQQCQVDANCMFKAMSESVSDLEGKAAAETAAGLGVAVSDVELRTAQEIQKKQEQDCQVTEADNYMESIDIGTSDQGTIENLDINQIGNVKQQCMFEGLSDSYMKSKADAESKSTGLFGGSSGALILGIVLIVGIGGAIYFFTSKQQAITSIATSYQRPSAPPSYSQAVKRRKIKRTYGRRRLYRRR